MIKSLKKIIFGLIIGLGLGLWFGVNYGRNQPLLSNPFMDKPLHQKLLDNSGSFLERSGRAIKDSLKQP